MNHLAQFKDLKEFNPLNLVQHGNQKVEHPRGRKSCSVSQDVEAMYKEFQQFHKNLKNLVMLYKTRHQLMDSLNENGLYTAKCYKEMFDGTPLSGVVASGRKKKPAESDPNARSLVLFGEGSGASPPSIEKDDDIDVMSYPDSSVIRKKLDPEEGSNVRKEKPEPEGLKSSKGASKHAGHKTSYLATIADELKDVDEDNNAKDPPSAASVKLGEPADDTKELERKDNSDPPTNEFPDDETGLSVERNPHRNDTSTDHGTDRAVNEMGASINYIVDDDDDSFTKADSDKKNGEELDDGDEHKKNNKDKGVGKKHDKEGLAFVPSNHDSDNSGSENANINEATPYDESATNIDMKVSEDNSDKKVSEDNEYLNISNEGDLIVLKNEVKAKPQPTPSSKQHDSYFDVHKAAAKELNAKLGEHSNLVQYVEEWEQTVYTRVQSRYIEYGKHRSSLNHYAKKTKSLLDEKDKMREKGREMKPKQLEKLERNQVKLKGSRETHDSAGKSLVLLMEEIVRRSWRDAFPLLTKSVSFEMDSAAIKQEHMAKLGKSSALLYVVGEKESISLDGRLSDLKNMKPEDMYTGSTSRSSSEEK